MIGSGSLLVAPSSHLMRLQSKRWVIVALYVCMRTSSLPLSSHSEIWTFVLLTVLRLSHCLLKRIFGLSSPTLVIQPQYLARRMLMSLWTSSALQFPSTLRYVGSSSPSSARHCVSSFSRPVTVCVVGGHTLSIGLHPFRFGWRTLVLESEAFKWEPPPWLSILAKSSLVSVCGERACVRCRLHVFAINIEFFFSYLHYWILPWWSER